MIGIDVPGSLLQAIVAWPAETVRHGLSCLQAAEFLYETRLLPEIDYRCKHALTHEVAYGSLLQERRRRLHARIVEALEALYADHVAEQVERCVHHALAGVQLFLSGSTAALGQAYALSGRVGEALPLLELDHEEAAHSERYADG